MLQLGELLALDAESLVVGEMPVEDIQFDRRHAVEVAPQNLERNEVAANVKHQSPPGKARLVFNRERGNGESIGSDVDELQKRLQSAHRAKGGGCIQLGVAVGDIEGVGLVLA